VPDNPPIRLHLAALAGVALFTLAAYLPLTAGPRVVYSQDTTDLNYVLVRSHVTDLKTQGFTAWCPGLGTGLYRPADPTLGLYSPRVLLYFLIDGYGAQLAGIVLYALLAGLGAYLLGLRLGGIGAAFFLGVSWPLAGVMVSMTINLPYFASAAWLPFVLWAWLKAEGRRWPAAGFFAGMVALDGDIFGMAFIVAALAAYGLIAPRRGRRAEALEAVAAGAVAVGISAIVWLPALAALPDSGRAGGMSVKEATAFSLHPLRLVNLFGPRFFGQPSEGSFWRTDLSSSIIAGGLWYYTIYLGFLAPLLAGLALAADRKRAAALLLPAAAFALLALGRHNPLVPWLIESLPGLAVFRYPAKLFMFAAFLLLAAAAAGAGAAGRLLAEPGPRRRAALVAGAYAVVGLAAMLSLAGHAGDAIKAAPQPGLAYIRIYQDLIRAALFAVGAPALCWFVGSRPRALAAALGVIAGLDLLTAGPAVTTNPRQDMDRPSVVAAAVRALGPGRLVISDDIYYHTHAGPRTALKQNWGILDGIDYAFGKTATLPARLESLYDRDLFRDQGPAIFRLLAARFILDHDNPGGPWRKKLEADGTLVRNQTWPEYNLALFVAPAMNPEAEFIGGPTPVPDRDAALSAARRAGAGLFLPTDAAVVGGRVVPAPALPKTDAAATGTVGLSERRRDEVILGVKADAPGFLVVRERLMRGWSAWLDDELVPIYWADGIGRAVYVPMGWHEVRFAFRPPRFGLGALVTLLALAAMVIGRIRWGLTAEAQRRREDKRKS